MSRAQSLNLISTVAGDKSRDGEAELIRVAGQVRKLLLTAVLRARPQRFLQILTHLTLNCGGTLLQYMLAEQNSIYFIMSFYFIFRNSICGSYYKDEMN